MDLSQVMADLEVVNADIRAAGGWVFAGGLAGTETATVIPSTGPITDGPFAESREHLGGISVVRAEDADTALDWARRIAKATGLPVELRPFLDDY
jgi:hypothetical protein